ncbi:MAG: DUF7059 domain-containing protein [Marmoricola sp.]
MGDTAVADSGRIGDGLGGSSPTSYGGCGTRCGRRASTTTGSPLSTLSRLWPPQATVAVADAELALPGLLDPLCVTGVLERSVGDVRACVDLRPSGSRPTTFWVSAPRRRRWRS